MAYLKAVYWIAYFTTSGTNWQFFFTSLICLEQEMSLKSNYIVVSYSTTNVTNCLVCFTSLFSVLHEINKDSENIMARIIFSQLPDQKLCWIVLFCEERRCCLTFIFMFPPCHQVLIVGLFCGWNLFGILY